VWDKGHGRLDHRRLARVEVSPESIGLGGCWQVIAVERTSQDTADLDAAPSSDIGCYATSLTLDQHPDAAILEIIRGHWSAIENGTHYRRDVTLGEDACRTKARPGAAVLASLRNLAIGVYELERERGRTQVDTLKSWCQRQTFSTVWPILNR
jgi:predicted transposase YbfD/YdcC